MPLHPLVERLLPVVGPPILRALMASWTVTITGADHLRSSGPQGRVFALWHGRQMALLPLISVGLPHGPMVVMTSASRDGQVQSKILSSLGMTPVTGSSSKRGAGALLEMARHVRRGALAVIAADGPVGPIYCAKSGLAVLARMSRTSIVPVGVSCQRAITLSNTWDEYRIPLPGARVALTLGTPIDPPRRGEQGLKDTMREVQRRLAELNGTAPTQLSGA